MHLHADVVVVGGGIAGLTAAEAAAASGVRVLLIDENPVLGGIADLTAGSAGEANLSAHAREIAARLAAMDNVHVLTRTTAVGHYHHNYMLAFERVADHDPALLSSGAPRHRLWRIRAGQVILATGALERPIAFANNDRPGIMLATAARALVERYGVSPGTSGVVFTNNDDAYLTALALKAAGVAVRARRPGPRDGRRCRAPPRPGRPARW